MNGMNSTLASLLLAVALPGWAQPAPAGSLPAAASQKAAGADASPETAAEKELGGEPNVRHTIIEDNGSKIDELKVRGQTRRITVTPKVGPTKSYEIITGDASRDTTSGTGGAKNAVGKRVWNVLDF